MATRPARIQKRLHTVSTLTRVGHTHPHTVCVREIKKRNGELRGDALLSLNETHPGEHHIEVDLKNLQCLDQIIVLDDEFCFYAGQFDLHRAGQSGP